MNKIDTVLFDFDGTIMNTNDLIIESWQHTFRQVTGKEGPLGKIKRSFGEPLIETTTRFFPDEDPEEVVQIYRSWHVERFTDSIRLFDGIPELLERLKDEGYTMGLVTARLYSTTKQGIDKFDLFRYFDALVTVEETKNPKPSPDPIHLCLKRLGKRPEKAIMVGDTKHDIQSAKAAGLPAVLVGWTMAVPKAEWDGPNRPDYILTKPADLPGVLAAQDTGVE
jgi:pyrophosphatase PpaX